MPHTRATATGGRCGARQRNIAADARGWTQMIPSGLQRSRVAACSERHNGILPAAEIAPDRSRPTIGSASIRVHLRLNFLIAAMA